MIATRSLDVLLGWVEEEESLELFENAASNFETGFSAVTFLGLGLGDWSDLTLADSDLVLAGSVFILAGLALVFRGLAVTAAFFLVACRQGELTLVYFRYSVTVNILVLSLPPG